MCELIFGLLIHMVVASDVHFTSRALAMQFAHTHGVLALLEPAILSWQQERQGHFKDKPFHSCAKKRIVQKKRNHALVLIPKMPNSSEVRT